MNFLDSIMLLCSGPRSGAVLASFPRAAPEDQGCDPSAPGFPAPVEEARQHAMRLLPGKARAKARDAGLDCGIERKPLPLAHQRLLQTNGIGARCQDRINPSVDRQIELGRVDDFLDKA